MRIYTLFTLLLLLSNIIFSQHTMNDIVDPKTIDGGYVANPDGIISREHQAEINQILADLEAADSFQVAVVALNSIGSEVPKDFATDLFAKWGIGNRDKDDGLLILFINDQRRIEFETGYGTESVLSDVQCKNIQMDYMVPLFKVEEYSEGILQGVKVTASELSGKKVDSYSRQEKIYDEKAYEAEMARINEVIAKERRARRIRWALIIAGWHVVGVLIFLITLLIVRYRQDPYDKYKTIRFFHAWIWAVFFPLTHIFIVILAKKLKNRYRNMIRFSGKTGEIMRKLEESDEDKYLSKGQITEELVHSVDYDVWITDNSDDTLVLEYRPLFSSYTKCPKCRYRTYYKVYDRQIIAPSYSSSGRGERKHECVNCKHVDRKTYTIPRLRRSSTTSRSGGWSGTGSSGGGGWSGGGGSWGGGSSGGGGAGSSW